MTTTNATGALRATLALHKLPQSGNRVEMMNRLLHNTGDQRKRGRPPKQHADKDEYDTFYDDNMKSLMDAGVSEDLAKTEVGRRWTTLLAERSAQAQKKKQRIMDDNTDEDTKNVFITPMQVTEEQIRDNNLVFIEEKNGYFKYMKIQPKPASLPNPSPKAAKATASRSDEEEEPLDLVFMNTHTRDRMLKHNSKEWIIAGLKEHGEPIIEGMTKKDMAARLAEMLLGETDNEAEAEDEDEV